MQKIITSIKKHRIKIILLLILILLIMGVSQVWGSKGKKDIVVITGEVIQNSFKQSIFATGTLEVRNKKDIFAEVATTVEEILLEPGKSVKAGQVILKLEADDLILKAAQAQAIYDEKRTELIATESSIRKSQHEFEFLKKEYQRKKALFNVGAVSQEELELAEKNMIIEKEILVTLQDARLPLIRAQMEEALVALEKARDTLRKATVISPIDGNILSIPIKEGHHVQPGTLLVSIGDLDNLQIETGINEVDAAELKVGDQVEISSEGLLENAYKGHIEYVAPIAELERTSQGEQTQVKIRVSVDDVDNSKLKPGYNVNLEIILAQKEEALLVPYEAVIERDNKDIVFVVDQEGLVFERQIEIGLSNELFFEVLNGVNVGEKVILNPNQSIKEGIKVKVNDQNK